MRRLVFGLTACLLFACETVSTNTPAQPAAQPVAAPAPPPPPPTLQEGDLRALSPKQVLGLFGSPSLDRQEGGVRILQFTSGRCVCDVVFDASQGLSYVEARAKNGTPIETQPCLDSFNIELPSPPETKALLTGS